MDAKTKIGSGLLRAFKELQYPSTYLCIAIGVVLIIQGLAIQVSVENNQDKVTTELVRIDDFMINIVDTINGWTNDLEGSLNDAGKFLTSSLAALSAKETEVRQLASVGLYQNFKLISDFSNSILERFGSSSR